MEGRIVLSIIVPVYNTSLYIDECLNSILEQDSTNIEIILVEDCSTDGSLELCKAYAEKYENIKLIIHHENVKIERTRNDGIENASGEWIMFLDSDDKLKEGCLDFIIKHLDNTASDFIIFPYYRWIGDAVFEDLAEVEPRTYLKEEMANMLLRQLPYSVLCCVGSKIYRRSFIVSNEIFFTRKYLYNEDGGFALTALHYSNTIDYLNFSYYIYRIRQNGSSQSTYRPNLLKNLSVTNKLLKQVMVETGAFEINSREYYIRYSSLICSSLFNEVLYRDYSSYREVFNFIRDMEDFKYVAKQFRKYKPGIGIAIQMINLDFPLLLFLLIKLRLMNTKGKRV